MRLLSSPFNNIVTWLLACAREGLQTNRSAFSIHDSKHGQLQTTVESIRGDWKNFNDLVPPRKIESDTRVNTATATEDKLGALRYTWMKLRHEEMNSQGATALKPWLFSMMLLLLLNIFSQILRKRGRNGMWRSYHWKKTCQKTATLVPWWWPAVATSQEATNLKNNRKHFETDTSRYYHEVQERDLVPFVLRAVLKIIALGIGKAQVTTAASVNGLL